MTEAPSLREAYWREASRDAIEAAAVGFFGSALNRAVLARRAPLRRPGLEIRRPERTPGAWFDHEAQQGGFLPTPLEENPLAATLRELFPRVSPEGFIYLTRDGRKRRKPNGCDREPESAEDKLARARAIWRGFSSSLPGTPAALYLENRGILAGICPDDAVRAGAHGDRPLCLFAYRAAGADIRAAKGRFRGVQRVYIDREGRPELVDGAKRKLALGAFDAGDGEGPAFFIARGDEGEAGPIYVAEGVEDALTVRAASRHVARPVRKLHLLTCGERLLLFGPAWPDIGYDAEDPDEGGGITLDATELRRLFGETPAGPVHEIGLWFAEPDAGPESLLDPAGPVGPDDPAWMRDEIVGTGPDWLNLDLHLRTICHELAHVSVGCEQGENEIWLAEFRRLWTSTEWERGEIHKMLRREIVARAA